MVQSVQLVENGKVCSVRGEWYSPFCQRRMVQSVQSEENGTVRSVRGELCTSVPGLEQINGLSVSV